MIEVDHLSKTYGSTAAIKDVSFTVEPGEILGFLGPNGAGKTTTMRILTGYLPATGGTARVAGKDVHADSMAVRQSIGYLPETPPLYPEMTVEGFLYFVARIKGVPAGELAGRVTSAIERCNLSEKRSVIIRKLSKGFRQRVGIAQAIVHNPPVIVLDEPTVGLDPRQIIEVRNLIKSLAGEHTIILSTHILPEVSATCDRITIINQGKIIATDSPEHLTARISGQSGYWVELAGQVESSVSVLQAVPGVMSVSPMDTDELAAGHVRYQVTTGTEDVGGVIARAVVTAGLELFELSRNRASLEDVFMDLTMQETAVPEEDINPASVFNTPEDHTPEGNTPEKTEAKNTEEDGTQPTQKADVSSEPGTENLSATNRDDSLDKSPAERASEVIEAAKARLRDNKPSQFDASADEEST